jgi:hypothetical protein
MVNRKRPVLVLAAALAGILGPMAPSALAAGESPAGVGPTAIAGYVWSGDTTGYYAFDSDGGTATIEGDGTGSYFADFPGLQDLTKEHIDISTYGAGAACALFNAVGLGSMLSVSINCYAADGDLADSAFDVLVTQPTRAPSGVFDYVLVPPAKSQELTGRGQYNSSGKANSVRHLSAGRYQITMPGPAASGATGTVQVTDVDHGSPGRCELAGWHGTRTGVVIDVGCFSLSGARQNRSFGASYVRSGNLMGFGGPTSNDHVTSAYAYASRPGTAVYQPASQYDSTRGATVAIIRQGRGRYLVIPSGSAGPYASFGGDVQVSAVGSADDRCSVASWDQEATPEIYVNCVTRHGAKANSAFTVQWTVPAQ